MNIKKLKFALLGMCGGVGFALCLALYMGATTLAIMGSISVVCLAMACGCWELCGKIERRDEHIADLLRQTAVYTDALAEDRATIEWYDEALHVENRVINRAAGTAYRSFSQLLLIVQRLNERHDDQEINRERKLIKDQVAEVAMQMVYEYPGLLGFQSIGDWLVQPYMQGYVINTWRARFSETLGGIRVLQRIAHKVGRPDIVPDDQVIRPLAEAYCAKHGGRPEDLDVCVN